MSGLLRRLVADDPGRPRVTWYGPGDERVELSGKVLQNWVSKTANLLMEELDAGPGTRVAVDLPGHWRTVVWLLATWAVGGCAVTGRTWLLGGAASPDILVTDRPEGAGDAGALVAVALPALAMAFGAALPAGALDAAVAVRGQGDVLGHVVRPTPAEPALEQPSGTVPHARLVSDAQAQASALAPGVQPLRLLTSAYPTRALPDVLGPLALGGSLVIHHDLAMLDEAVLRHLVAQERVSARSHNLDS